MLGRKLIFSIFVLLGVMQMELNAAYSVELIKGGGTDTSNVNKRKWSTFGTTYGQQSRRYRGKAFIYATPKVKGSGLYQSISTKIGKTYAVSAILIGADTNRQERFTGVSYLTVSSSSPRTSGSYVIAQSSKVSGGRERKVTFSFTARTSRSYLALRSNQRYKYSSARFISVKETGNSSQPVQQPTTTPQVQTPTPTVPNYNTRTVSLQRSNPIVVSGNNITIENKIFRGNGRNIGIKVNKRSNVTIKNCLFINFKEAISINKSNNIKVIGSRFENGFTSIRVLSSSNVHIIQNEALNIGHFSVSRGANFVTFDKIEGGSIRGNRVENQLGQSENVEDIISIYRSHGRSGNPILVEGNWLRGRGKSHSGSCVMTGDNSGSYTLVRNNIGVNCGQVGMGIAGGHHNELSNNILVHTKLSYFSSAGLYAAAYKGYGGGNNIIKNNKVSWWSSADNVYFGSSFNKSLPVTVYNNTGLGWNRRDASLSANVLPRNLFPTDNKAYFSGRNK